MACYPPLNTPLGFTYHVLLPLWRLTNKDILQAVGDDETQYMQRAILCHHYDVIRSPDHSTQHRRFPIGPHIGVTVTRAPHFLGV